MLADRWITVFWKHLHRVGVPFGELAWDQALLAPRSPAAPRNRSRMRPRPYCGGPTTVPLRRRTLRPSVHAATVASPLVLVPPRPTARSLIRPPTTPNATTSRTPSSPMSSRWVCSTRSPIPGGDHDPFLPRGRALDSAGGRRRGEPTADHSGRVAEVRRRAAPAFGPTVPRTVEAAVTDRAGPSRRGPPRPSRPDAHGLHVVRGEDTDLRPSPGPAEPARDQRPPRADGLGPFQAPARPAPSPNSAALTNFSTGPVTRRSPTEFRFSTSRFRLLRPPAWSRRSSPVPGTSGPPPVEHDRHHRGRGGGLHRYPHGSRGRRLYRPQVVPPVMSAWACDQGVAGSFTDRVRSASHVPESVRRTKWQGVWWSGT